MYQWGAIILFILFIAGALCSIGTQAFGADCDPTEPLQSRLIRHEGIRSCAYPDTLGNPTIGVGHLLRKPVPDWFCWERDKIIAVLRHDTQRAEANARHDLGDDAVWSALSDSHRNVLIEMAFQLGGHGLSLFRQMLVAVRHGDMDEAARQIRMSRLYLQTPGRAEEMACLLENR